MKVVKLLNQNAVIVDDEGEEKVAIGKGIGFNKKMNDLIFPREIERLFTMESEGQKKLQSLLSQIDEKFLFATEKIIEKAEITWDEKLDNHLFIALTDHISFAAENAQKGFSVHNRLLPEIEILFRQEFEIAKWAIQFLKNKLGINLGVDEAGYIAIHLNGAREKSNSKRQSMQEATVISDIIHLIGEETGIQIHAEEMLLNYSRLVNHLRQLLQRYNSSQSYTLLDPEMIEMIKNKYIKSYQVAESARQLLLTKYSIAIDTQEIGYLALHIERLV
ncbi:PRD domain-containing protein [Lactococcus garvieae]|uniref:PRD domain-containing protein n=1 Tax=Lactococcus garvieae TaxID=1363 RepID=UPI003854569A